MKLNPETFREKLKERLLADATNAEEGGSWQDACLLGASLLEQGKRCPRWIASPFVARVWQDAYGMAGMLEDRRIIDAIFDTCIERS